jgi:hypothetical protein
MTSWRPAVSSVWWSRPTGCSLLVTRPQREDECREDQQQGDPGHRPRPSRRWSLDHCGRWRFGGKGVGQHGRVVARLRYMRRDGVVDTEDRWLSVVPKNGRLLIYDSERIGPA